ncbi:periplasmic heavy metal sensor [Oceanicola sp. D3]|uniref:periplasmic heavy metal sensor n=1 Tax=Oceanicola sp. D3 TaxID=2587163 RepID=UPI00111FEF8B|nr:periplasmic heavy metal sensor [Oceanicola sp. D3]QDC09281.1 periplasmic heavy metal sensor [Oceanicola sp. D3]
MKTKRNWGRMALIAVLALSLFGNAVTLGAVMKIRANRQALTGPGVETVRFPRPLRRTLNAALRDNAAQLRPALQRLAAARRAMVEKGTARPFDRAATEAAIQAFRAEAAAVMTELQPILLDTLEREAAN